MVERAISASFSQYPQTAKGLPEVALSLRSCDGHVATDGYSVAVPLASTNRRSPSIVSPSKVS